MTETNLYEQAFTAALKVAVLDAVASKAADDLKKARAEAEGLFAVTGKLFPQVNVVLPDGRHVGRLTVKEAAPRVIFNSANPAILADWCRDHYPDGLEEYVDPDAFSSLDVIAAVKAKVPAVVRSRLRTTAAEALLAEIKASGGWLEDKATKEREKVAEVKDGGITGEFAFSDQKGPQRRAAIIDAWRAGVIDLAPMLALPAAGGESGA